MVPGEEFGAAVSTLDVVFEESLLSLKKSHLLRQIDEDSSASAVGDVGDVAASTSSGALPASSYMDDEFAAFQVLYSNNCVRGFTQACIIAS